MKRRLKTIPGIGNLFALTERPEAAEERTPDTTIIDDVEREEALDITKSWVVEAPAGSGKTGLLIQRYLKLLTQPEVSEPEQVLAITFTQKAAGEIRDRIIEQLVRAGDAQTLTNGFADSLRELAIAVLSRDGQLGWGLLEHPERLNLRTIDSLCAEIARSTPIFSGRGDFTPVEDAKPLYRSAAEQTLLQLGGNDARLSEALAQLLLHRDGDLQRCRDLLAEMLGLRDQWGRLIPLNAESLDSGYLESEVLPHLEKTLADVIEGELIFLHRTLPKQTLEQLCSLLEEMAHAPGYRGEASPIAACAGDSSPVEPVSGDLERWRALAHLLLNKDGSWRRSFWGHHLKFEISRGHSAEINELIAPLRDHESLRIRLGGVLKLPPAKFPPDQWRIAKALFVVLHHALAELQIVFAERGECDFTEVSLVARAALLAGATAGSRGQAELRHMLVDEMQDTSTSQYELLQLLTQAWDGHSQTVFFVGDPKQSIYLFRQARVERFIRMAHELRIGELSLGLLRLRSNFRSQAGLVESFNAIFPEIFSEKEDAAHSQSVGYTPAYPVREPSSAAKLAKTWHARVISAGLDTMRVESQRLEEDEANEIRRIIERWRSKPLPEGRDKPWTIAVLVRNRNHLLRIVPALRSNDGDGPIPFRAVNIDSLAERPEVLDLFSLTRAILHPADRIAWLSILRAPWCGLSLADLHMLCGQDDSSLDFATIAELIDKRGELLSDEGQSLLQRIEPLFVASKQRGRLPASELVERTWKTLGGDTYLQADEVQNTNRYFNLLGELETTDAGLDLQVLHRRLKALYASPSASEDAVDLMTIHGAKGLEWDVVLLPGLAKTVQSDGNRLLNWDELSDRDEGDVLLAPIVGKGEASERLNDWLRSIQRKRQAEEAKRLFYVACTRAKEELHLFAALKQKKDGSLGPASGTLLAAAWPAAEKEFIDEAIASKPVIAPVITIRESGNNLVIPSLAAETAKVVSASESRRLPLGTRTRASLKEVRPRHHASSPRRSAFVRPEGSFVVRAFGYVVHTMLEYAAKRISQGDDVPLLLSEIPAWSGRIEALFRTAGVSSTDSRSLVSEIQRALTSTLTDANGLWLLSPHENSASEYALTHWDADRLSLRLDRVFLAGHEPLQEGSNCLWIVDFKTTKYPGDDTTAFLDRESAKYAPQLEAYAAAIAAAFEPANIRLGLYYPMLAQLIWWEYRAVVSES